VQLSRLACLAEAATRVDFAAQGRPGVRVIPTNVLHLQEMQEGGALSFRSGCYENNAPSYRPLFFRTLPGAAMEVAWGMRPHRGGHGLPGVPVLQPLAPFTKGRPRNHENRVIRDPLGRMCRASRKSAPSGQHTRPELLRQGSTRRLLPEDDLSSEKREKQ
jgi:hypothetical protein